MSRFDDLLDEIGLPTLFDMSGDSITYTPKGGAGVSLTALVGVIETRETEQGTKVRERDVVIATDASGPYGGVAAPSTKATVTIAGVEWAITDLENESASMVRLRCQEKKKLEIRRKDYREAW